VESQLVATRRRVRREEETMRRRAARAYLDGFGTAKSVLEIDGLTAREIAEALDPEREDPLINPWRRGYNAAIRSAWGR
jgi:hypothetical protein